MKINEIHWFTLYVSYGNASCLIDQRSKSRWAMKQVPLDIVTCSVYENSKKNLKNPLKKKGIPQGDFKKRLEEFDGPTRVFSSVAFPL